MTRRKPGSLSANFVHSILVDAANNLWIGTNLGGLNQVELPSHWSVLEKSKSRESLLFSLEFSALDFTQPSKNRYAYKLEGFNVSCLGFRVRADSA